MKAAFAYWEKRVAPVFDTARQIHLVEVEFGRVVNEIDETLHEDFPVQKTLRLLELGVQVLVCGAISRDYHVIIASYGIQIFPFVAGDLDEVIRAWLEGNLGNYAFTMPGCYGRGGGRFRGRHHAAWGSGRLNAGQGGRAALGGRSRRQKGKGRGRMV